MSITLEKTYFMSVAPEVEHEFAEDVQPIVAYIRSHYKILVLSLTHLVAFCMKSNGKPLCIFTLQRKMFPLIDLNAILYKRFHEHDLREILCITKKIIEEIFRHDVSRIQCSVSENKKHRRFVEYFGFQCEGQMKKFGINGETYFLYALTK
jgi:hypothetical protein